MKVSIEPRKFQPVTIVFETQDELDQIQSILYLIGNNVINYSPQHINAARNMYKHLEQKLIDERTPS